MTGYMYIPILSFLYHNYLEMMAVDKERIMLRVDTITSVVGIKSGIIV